MKSEGDCYSIDDLKKDKITAWSGVRNYQARNFMRDHMKKGDMVLFYHSSSKPTGVYGIAKVTANAHADETQFEKEGEYFDPKSTRENARWQCVDVGFVSKFKQPVTLAEIKFDNRFAGMMVRAKRSRLSIQPVSEKHFRLIEELGK